MAGQAQKQPEHQDRESGLLQPDRGWIDPIAAGRPDHCRSELLTGAFSLYVSPVADAARNSKAQIIRQFDRCAAVRFEREPPPRQSHSVSNKGHSSARALTQEIVM